jgi:hypothetical protein
MRKIQNLKSIQFSNDFTVISSRILEWKKRKPIPELDELIEAVQSWFFYTHELETTQWYWEKSIEEYRSSKLRALDRARRAEKELEEVKKELDNYKKAYG